MTYEQVVSELESKTIMPKTMPGLDKIKRALNEKSWYLNLNPKKIITVAGTNGKGTTCAALEALLLTQNKKVGLYTSPHLVTTAERIRINGVNISKDQFAKLYLKNKDLMERYDLSHFECLTLMAGDYFFNPEWNVNLDYAIFEVGLGGTYDATNAFPNYYSVITKIGMDHENILGNSILEIAKNKLGIIKSEGVVVHWPFDTDVKSYVQEHFKNRNIKWNETPSVEMTDFSKNQGQTKWGVLQTNQVGLRILENTNMALTLFEQMGFDVKSVIQKPLQINWNARMQKIAWPNIPCPVYLSGDHNPQGIESLLEILKNLKWKTLHLVVGIGKDKAADEMLEQLLKLPNMKLYLTETPFKGLKTSEYPESIKSKAVMAHADVAQILNQLKTESEDLVLVTGSLYLAGSVLSHL